MLFFLDIDAPDGQHVDNVGTRCPDIHAARQKAMRTLYEVAAFAPADAEIRSYTVFVRDAQRRVVFEGRMFVVERLVDPLNVIDLKP